MTRFLFVCVAMLYTVVNGKSLPEFPEPCHKSDPNINSCYQNALNKYIPYMMATGLPEYGIPTLDPLDAAVAHFNEPINELMSVDMTAKNAKVVGLSQVVLDNVKVGLKPFSFVADMNFPLVHVTGAFKFIVNLENVPLELEGSVVGNFSDIKVHVAERFKRVKKQGVKYLSVANFTSNFTVGHIHTELYTKNPEQQHLADYITKFYNENEKTVNALTSTFSPNVATDLFRSILEQLFSYVPFEKFLVD